MHWLARSCKSKVQLFVTLCIGTILRCSLLVDFLHVPLVHSSSWHGRISILHVLVGDALYILFPFSNLAAAKMRARVHTHLPCIIRVMVVVPWRQEKSVSINKIGAVHLIKSYSGEGKKYLQISRIKYLILSKCGTKYQKVRSKTNLI